MPITVVEHPIIDHCLAGLRDRETQPTLFRVLTRRVTLLLAARATADLPTRSIALETPLEETKGQVIDEFPVAVPVLRAGLGMLDAVIELFPDVAVGYVGLERDHETAIARCYYSKMPSALSGRRVLILDPMLATGGSAAHAISAVKELGAGQVTLICIVAAPEGVAHLSEVHPDVPIFTAALDRELNDLKYILPGLGRFGDRLYGT